jgi:hypothetical protein
MAQGFFVVSPSANGTDITFQICPTTDGDPPEEQAKLVTDLDRALRVLRAVFDGRELEYKRYFVPLLTLSQGGLVGPRAQPEIARRALIELKQEVLEREAGRFKNQYMLRLGAAAIWFAGPSLALALASRSASTFPALNSPHGVVTAAAFSHLCFLLAGCAAGVWISFGARKASLTFEDLSVPEADYLRPLTRLALTELLTVALALLFQTRVIEVNLGAISTADVFSQPIVALLVGILAGFSEQVLSKQLATQAGRLFAAS